MIRLKKSKRMMTNFCFVFLGGTVDGSESEGQPPGMYKTRRK